MTETKYAGLPGIAYDQPDVYESEDIPETDQDMTPREQSDSIEIISSNIRDTYSKFQGHWLDTRKADFSGKISATKQMGYSSWYGPFELQAQGEKETLLQKFNRLKCEVAELEEELAQAKEAKVDEKHTAADLTVHVDRLQKQLHAMNIDDHVVTSSLVNTSSGGLAKQKLFSQIEQLTKVTPLGAYVDSSSTSNNTKNIVYELSFNPQLAKLETASKVSHLQKRLDKLEQILGASQEKMTQLSAETGQKSLADSVKLIHSKVLLLEPSHIDQIEARLGLLVQKLNSMGDKKAVLEDADKQGKVAEVYDMIKKLEPMMYLIPAVIDRLVALKELHGKASNFSNSLTEVENVQDQLNGSLTAHSQLLRDIKDGLIINMNVMTKTVENLEGRLSAMQ